MNNQSIRARFDLHAKPTKLLEDRSQPIYLLDPKLAGIAYRGSTIGERRRYCEYRDLVHHSGNHGTGYLGPVQHPGPDVEIGNWLTGNDTISARLNCRTHRS